MKSLVRSLVLILALLAGAGLRGAETIPPAPARYFNDYAGTVSPAVGNELNTQLEQFERTSSNQLLVAIFPRMESDSSVEDYTVRVAQAWKAGQRTKSNGAVLFAFMQEHQLYIQVGYGLEATLTDATAHDIIENILKPAFRRNDYAGGLQAAVTAMIAATKGEYHGNGGTVADKSTSATSRLLANIRGVAVGVFVLIWLLQMFFRSSRPYMMSGRQSRYGGFMWGGGSGWGGGGGWSGGGGGGGFSGGGGSFGGGGAGGKW